MSIPEKYKDCQPLNSIVYLLDKEKVLVPELPAGSQVIADIKINSEGNFFISSYPDYPVISAVSCLLSLQEDDRVRVIFDKKNFVVTDILSRKEGDLIIDGNERNLHVTASNVTISAKDKINIRGNIINVLSDTTRWLAERMYQISHLLSVKTDDAFRQVKNCDDVQANNIHHEANSTFTVKGKLTSVKGSAVLKVDGGQIHMG